MDLVFQHVADLNKTFADPKYKNRIVEFGIPEYMNSNFEKVTIPSALQINLKNIHKIITAPLQLSCLQNHLLQSKLALTPSVSATSPPY